MRLNKSTLRISSRKSELARLQAYQVGEAINKHFRRIKKEIKIEYNFRESLGDRNLNNPLWQMPEKGVFTQDFKNDLLTDQTDLVVHSWKDIPIEDHSQTQIMATLLRADERDVLLLKKSACKSSQGMLKIYSSSPRREFNLTPFFAWSLPFKPTETKFFPVRGNIQTRIKKTLDDHKIDGIIVAKAALDRLLVTRKSEFAKMRMFIKSALKKFFIQVIPLSQSPTASGQGALAIEVLKKNSFAKRIVGQINAALDFDRVIQERIQFKKWGGGCHQKMGVTYKSVDSHWVKFEKGLDQKNSFVWNQEVVRTDFGQIKKTIPTNQIVEFNLELQKKISNSESHTAVHSAQGKAGLSVQYTAKKNDCLILTRGNLLSPGSHKQVTIWTSGIETWKQVAEQGYWVTGSYDSLGERQAPEVELLLGQKPKWLKLTHTKGHTKKWAKTLKLYSVEYAGLEKMARHRKKSYFYWSHGDLFQISLKKFPWLKNKKHICGLGATLDTIRKHIEKKNIIPVYNFKEWKKKWIQ